MSQQNPPRRQSYLAASVTVTATATRVATLIETLLGYTANSLAGLWREITIQIDPVTAPTGSAAWVYIGNGNVGSTVGGIVQKGSALPLAGSASARSVWNNVDISMLYARTDQGTMVINIQLWPM